MHGTLFSFCHVHFLLISPDDMSMIHISLDCASLCHVIHYAFLLFSIIRQPIVVQAIVLVTHCLHYSIVPLEYIVRYAELLVASDLTSCILW